MDVDLHDRDRGGRRGRLRQRHRRAVAHRDERRGDHPPAGEHLEREADPLDDGPLHGPVVGRSTRARRRGHPRWNERRRHPAVHRHPRVHHPHRAARAAGDRQHAQRVLHADGRLHPARGRHARQVHRRRHHGGLRPPPAGTRRRRSSRPHRHRHDPLAERVELVPGRRRPAADQHGHRPQHRRRGRRQHRLTEADGLHDDRRRRQPRGPARGRLQGVPRPDPDQ